MGATYLHLKKFKFLNSKLNWILIYPNLFNLT